MNIHSLRFRLTAWYAGLLMGALLLFGVSVYLGLDRYLDWMLQDTLSSECRTIGTKLLSQFPDKSQDWLKAEIDEAYAPEVNSRFIRVYRQGTELIYLSGAPKDGTFDPSQISSPQGDNSDTLRRIRLATGQQLLIRTMGFTTHDGSRFLVESGMPYRQIQLVLHGLFLTLAIYTPLLVFLAISGGYWLMRRSLQPIDEITARAEGITSSNLSERLPVIRTGDELEHLSAALNRMITRLDEAFQHINRFSADASHELRTPLTILQLELEGIVSNHALSVTIADQIGSALEETNRMSRIVESLLTISRLDAGETKLDRLPLDFGALVHATSSEMRIMAHEKSIALRMNTESGVWVRGDRTRLQQIVVNLVDNAIKYTPEAGLVEVRSRAENGAAVLEVEDNGVGIPPHAIPHVFERFYRVDKARSRASGGAGLGLSIVKAICAAHGGEIQVSSLEGRGSCFQVRLPLDSVPDSANSNTDVRRRPTRVA